MTVGKSEADFGLALVGRYLLFIAIAKGLCVAVLFRIAAEVRVPRPRAAFLLKLCVVGVSQGDEGVASSGKEGIAALLAQSRSVICRQGLSASVRRRGRGG